MQWIARDERGQSSPVWRHPDGQWPIGTALTCSERDVAVFVASGRVLGTLGPGRYALDPAQFPFLAMLGAPGGVVTCDVVFVDVAPISSRFGGRADVGGLSGVGVFGTVWLRITDPVRLVQNLIGDVERGGAMLVDGSLVVPELAGALARTFPGAVSPASLGDPSRLGELDRQIGTAVAQRLAPLGVEIARIDDLAVQPPSAATAPAASTAGAAEPVYEMMWDCRHCGAAKLLGLTHRHCPNCGAPQNAGERYFPPESEKVAVADHRYVGADRMCRYCGNASSRQCKHCGTCGGPLEEGTDAALRAEPAAVLAVAGPVEPARKKKSAVGWIIGGTLCALLGLVLVAVFWKKSAAFTVAGLQWKRSIQIERYGAVDESDWCDRMPAGAVVRSRSREVRSHEKVQNGEDCQTRKVDHGDGTYREKRECKPVYEDKPIYGDKCRYTVRKWHSDRSVEASGSSASDAPRWPAVSGLRAGSCEGCEREGRRSESYTVSFTNSKDHGTSSCDFDQAKWQTFAPRSRWRARVRVLGGSLDCGSLERQ